jgi:hypothetical protein
MSTYHSPEAVTVYSVGCKLCPAAMTHVSLKNRTRVYGRSRTEMF